MSEQSNDPTLPLLTLVKELSALIKQQSELTEAILLLAQSNERMADEVLAALADNVETSDDEDDFGASYLDGSSLS